MDFADISKWVNPLIDRMDHRHLGTIEFDVRDSWRVEGMPYDLYPSSENLLYWIGEQLSDLPWSQLTLEETCTSYAALSREEFNATRNESRAANA